MWELRGPHTPTSDLEQPAYKPTDINTPEEDTTLDEPQTQRLRIGRQNSQQIPKKKLMLWGTTWGTIALDPEEETWGTAWGTIALVPQHST